VVVGTDGSATAALAVRHAAELAVASGAELVVVSAYLRTARHDRDLAEQREAAPEDVRWAVTDVGEAEDHLRAARAAAVDAGVATVRTRAEEGDPADVLVSTAEELLADVIVVGSKGMTSAARFLLGSVPNKVSHHAPCDVLIVRTT
jgi:nucleotide-binding universal stress UspA family protein